MWLSLTALLAVRALLVDSLMNRELEMKFQLRTPGDWEREWHQERYARCSSSITRHMRWACEKDIYKLKRVTKRTENILNLQNFDKVPLNYDDDNELEDSSVEIKETFEMYPWIEEKLALGLLRKKRGFSKRGTITTECCSKTGCTWEEYAEYCTQNNRKVPHKRFEYVTDY